MRKRWAPSKGGQYQMNNIQGAILKWAMKLWQLDNKWPNYYSGWTCSSCPLPSKIKSKKEYTHKKTHNSQDARDTQVLLTLPSCSFSSSSCWGNMLRSVHHFGLQRGENLPWQRGLMAENLATAPRQEWSYPRFHVLAEKKHVSPVKPAQAGRR